MDLSKSVDGGSALSLPWARVENFVGLLAHDIRNGLNSFELQLTFLGEIATDAEMVEEVKRLRGTLAGITRQLQAVRTATGSVSMHPLDYPAQEFLDDLRERFNRLHPEASNRIEWHIEISAEVLLTIDPELTLSALLELLRNALQFAKAASTITIWAGASDGVFKFTLQEPQDHPPSIPLEDWGRLPLHSSRRGAYGLGLFRARRSIEVQHGTLRVEYSPQKLLISVVSLPLSSQPSS